MNVFQPGFTLVLLAAAVAATAADVDSADIESLTVYGQHDPLQGPELTADRRQHGVADAARLFELLPGANTNENGALSGQLQYRGLFGPRTEVRVNGLSFPAGGPNWMDPPMHYVPPGLLERLSLQQGISAVNNGNIGGHAEAEWKRPRFADSNGWRNYFDVDSNLRSNDSGYGLAATAGIANDSHRLYISGNQENGGNYRAGGHTVDGSEFARQAYAAGYGWQAQRWAAEAAYYRIESADAGTPSLPLDIDFFRTDLWQTSLSTTVAAGKLTLSVGGSDIQHGMHNNRLRPTPDFSGLPLPPFAGADARQVRVDSQSLEIRLGYELAMAGGTWSSGLDFNTEQHSARISDPDFAPFFVDNINGAEQHTTALFSSWQGALSSHTQLQAGVRLSRSASDADPVDALPAQLVDANPAAWPLGTPPRAVFVLRERFNNAERKQTHTLFDWMVKLHQQFTEQWTLETALARKSRLPIYLEQYLWLPLEVNAGLGDGNNYVGNPAIDAEVSHQAELALGWQGGQGYLSPRLFYHKIDHYIQGVAVTDPVAIAVSANANGDPTPLMFANVDARLYGLDMAFGWHLSDNWRVDGNLAFVRARRTDQDDNLHRIAPPSLRTGLTWLHSRWQLTLEHLAYARQDNLSRTISDDPASAANNFAEVPGYGIFNLYANFALTEQWTIDLGLENLNNKKYRDPLSGFNRNAGNGVAIGQRLPGRGRNAFLRVHYRLQAAR